MSAPAPETPASPCVCEKFKAGHYACLDCFLATERPS